MVFNGIKFEGNAGYANAPINIITSGIDIFIDQVESNVGSLLSYFA